MSDPKPMPRQAVVIAGGLIALSAIAGLAFGAVGDIKGRGGLDPNGGDVVEPIKTVANATPLVAPPVTEADVRRWAREELQTQRPAAPKRPRTDTSPDSETDQTDTPDATATPLTAAPVKSPPPATPAKPAAGQQIPF